MMGPDEKGIIQYATGIPTLIGVYACRIDDECEGLKKDIFLMWHDNKWCYLRSDQIYRSNVYGWIGPLARKQNAK